MTTLERGLDLEQKLGVLMSLAEEDREGPPQSGTARTLPPRLRNVQRLTTLRPLNIRSFAGHTRRLLRILMTNACSLNCHYCPMRRDRELPRTLLKPEEMVRVFLGALRRDWCDGLFITTGIAASPVKTTDSVITVLELLRERHRFRGYIHVKLVPGAETAQIERIVELSNRVSVNLEAPCGDHLAAIAPEKDLTGTLVTLERARGAVVRASRESAGGRPVDPLRPLGSSGMTMQFVVGATPDRDRAILDRTADVYAGGGIHHAHFSAFRPIRDTPLEGMAATPAIREQRLYQADYLLRDYGFSADEVVYDADGNLPLGLDPKSAWALAHPERFPIEVRTASRSELMRVPGIGATSARRIIETRAATVIRDLADLRRLGVVVSRAAGFLMLAGRRLSPVRWSEQLALWSPAEDVGRNRAMLYDASPGTFR